METFKPKHFIGRRILALITLLVFVATPMFKLPLTAHAKGDNFTKIVLLLGSESYLVPLAEAYSELTDYPIDLVVFRPSGLKTEDTVNELRDAVADSDLFLLEMVGATTVLSIEPLLVELHDNGWTGTTLATRSSPFPPQYGIKDDLDGKVGRYFGGGGMENMRRMLLYLATTYGNIITDQALEPVVVPGQFIYHPAAAKQDVGPGQFEEKELTLAEQAVPSKSPQDMSLIDTAEDELICAEPEGEADDKTIIDSVEEIHNFGPGTDELDNPTVQGTDAELESERPAKSDAQIQIDAAEVANSQDAKDANNPDSQDEVGLGSEGILTALKPDPDEIDGVEASAAAVNQTDEPSLPLVFKTAQLRADENSADKGDGASVPLAGEPFLDSILPEDALADEGDAVEPLLYSELSGVRLIDAKNELKEDGLEDDNLKEDELREGELEEDELEVEEDIAALPPGTFATLKDYLAWYEDSGNYHPGAAWVGILTYSSSFVNNDYDMYTAILEEIEAKGANAILVFSSNHCDAISEYFMPDGSSQIDFLIAAVGFNLVYGEPQAGVELLRELNVPVMTPVHSSDLEEWQGSIAGVTSEISWLIAFPELDGRIEPVFIGGRVLAEVDENTGVELVKDIPLADRIRRVVDRALAWTELRRKGNADKKIALVYYAHHGGKDDIGASYLNSIASTSVILEAMQEEGYYLNGDLSNQGLEELMLGVGRNVGSWAPGELEKLVQAGAMKLPLEKYLEWYEAIPASAREELEKEWGPAPGDMMVHEGQLVIPGAILGNVFLGPQPMRGWGEDPSKIAHSPTMPPPHQYLAFYFWLEHEFKADAVIHLGTHGTLEWLPGRSVGLGADDWPDIVMGNLPDIYPYIVNNPGEGTQAKRRGYAVTVDHLTPPMIQPGLYGTLDELQQLIIAYGIAVSEANSERALYLQEQIIEKVKQNSLDQDLGFDLNDDDFDEMTQYMHEYLEVLATELMPYGLHTFGLPPQGEMLDLMVDAIVGYNQEAREGSRKAIKDKLLLSTDEIKNLLRVLNGEYLEPGLGRDPVRVPDALPTGRNMVSFDPRMVPDEAAWRTGREAADQLLKKFYAENGRYPETVGVVLWAVETMRTQGESIGLILRLMGVEPAWDESGRVNAIEVTPLSELGRPRINVVVTISGLFRDTFGHTIGVLDEAFRQVASLGESSDKNYVRKTYADLRDYLLGQGLSSEQADDLAQARIFGDPPGAYGAGVSGLAESASAWEDSQQLAESYMNNMSHIYGKTAFGVPAQDVFREILKSVEVITQVKDSLWGALDNDDVADYLGGLKLAAEAASGRDVSAYIVNTRNASVRVQSFSEFVGTELRSRLFNPKWIEGMLKEGYAGFREIGQHVGHMFLVDATLDSIEDWAWQQVAETFIFDEQMMKQLGPFVTQSIIAWNLEAARRDMWQTDKETLAELANRYVETAVEYGVVCCHHTCNHIVLNEWAAKYSTVDSNIMDKFKDVFYDATERRLRVATDSQSSSPSKPEPKPEVQPKSEVEPIRPLEPEPEEVEKQAEAVTSSGATNIPPVAAGSDTAESQALAEASAPVGDQAAIQAMAQIDEEPEQPAEAEEGSEKEVKAYEITEETEPRSTSTGTKAVSAIAIIVALGIVAVFFRGYIRRQG